MATLTTKTETAAEQAPAAAVDGQYLVFTLAGEQFAVEVPRLLQIRSWGDVVPVPGAPDYVLGRTDLQGSKLIVVDLRARLALGRNLPTPRTLVIVLSFTCNGVFLPVGFTVDASSGAQELAHGPGNLEPDRHLAVSRDFVRGTATADGREVVVLDTDSLVDPSVLAGEATRRIPGSGRVH